MKYKIIVDKQSRTNPSTEKREYEIDIEELRCKGDVYDSLVITKDEDYIMRRLSLSDLHVLKVLDEPVKEPLADINIELFEGDNYIYLVDMTGNKFYAEYLVKNDFTDLYVTTNQMNSAINQSASQIELTVNQKLEGYSDTTEMNSAITQKANEITSTVSETYATKTELSTAKTEIKQTTDSISSIVSKKVGNDEIISKINQTAEDFTIDSSRININGTVSANGNFKVDTNGNMECNNGTFNGGYICLYDRVGEGACLNMESDGYMSAYSSHGLSISNSNVADYYEGVFVDMTEGTEPTLIVRNKKDNFTFIKGSGIETPKLTQTSLESQKKNFEKMQDNALNIINDIDIYKYNLKSEEDTDKKHIGFVIGDNYKYSKEVTSTDNNGVDLYSFTSLCCKAIQEQQALIEQLQERDKQKDNQIAELTKRLERLEATNGKN